MWTILTHDRVAFVSQVYGAGSLKVLVVAARGVAAADLPCRLQAVYQPVTRISDNKLIVAAQATNWS